MTKRKKVLVFLGIIILGIIGTLLFSFFQKPVVAPSNENNLNYEVKNKQFKLEVLVEDFPNISRIKITPDGKVMFVATLTGNVFAFTKKDGVFREQDDEDLFYSLSTGFPGFPGEENGLTGFILAADYDISKEIFLTYTMKNDQGVIRNKILRLTVKEQNGIFIATEPTEIFEGKSDSAPAHQIQGGVGLMINGKSHILFTIGDAGSGMSAQNEANDTGKIMLIQRDGSNPLGERPYPDNPKVQALGIRNAFDIALNPYDPQKRLAIGDTGTGHNDKFLYGKVIDLDQKVNGKQNFLWDGSEGSLLVNVIDYNIQSLKPEMVLHRWDPTQTPLDIVFYPGKVGGIPESTSRESYFLQVLFGPTGSTDINDGGRRILLGKISLSDRDGQPRVTFEDFVVRSQASVGKAGHPIGLAYDSTTLNIYFADIIEGKIYVAKPIQ